MTRADATLIVDLLESIMDEKIEEAIRADPKHPNAQAEAQSKSRIKALRDRLVGEIVNLEKRR